MANVYFKRGSQAALDTLISNVQNSVSGAAYVEGAFYLTNDTNRLYFAQSNSELVDLNQYIHFVQERSGLPTSATATLKEGDIYYIKGENILCIYKNGSWDQINPDTALSPNQTSVIGVETNNGTSSVGVRLTDTKGTVATGNFSITGGSNVTVSSSGNVITIASTDTNTDTTYDLTTTYQTTKGQIKLDSSDPSATDPTIDIVGTGSVSVSSTADGTITIAGGTDITGISNEFDASGAYAIQLSRGQNSPFVTTPITPTITYGVAQGSQDTAYFYNGAATLDVYTKTEVDNLLTTQQSQMDAMRYKGVLYQDGAAAALVSAPPDGVGTTWKAGENIVLSSPAINAKTGDLIIAGGDNDNAVSWQVVPSGDDQLLSISGSTSEHAVIFHDGVSNTNIGSVVIQGGQKEGANATETAANANIEVGTAVSGTGNKNTIYTVVHGNPGTGTAVSIPAASGAAVQTTGTALTIPVITGITKDAQGHVTNVTAQNYQLTDTHATLNAITKAVETSNNATTVAFTFQLDSQTARSTNLTITSDNLTVDKDSNNNVVINLEWGSFT